MKSSPNTNIFFKRDEIDGKEKSRLLGEYPEILSLDKRMLEYPTSFQSTLEEVRGMIYQIREEKVLNHSWDISSSLLETQPCGPNPNPNPTITPTYRRSFCDNALRAVSRIGNSAHSSSNFDTMLVEIFPRLWRFIKLYNTHLIWDFLEALIYNMNIRTIWVLSLYAEHMKQDGKHFQDLTRKRCTLSSKDINKSRTDKLNCVDLLNHKYPGQNDSTAIVSTDKPLLQSSTTESESSPDRANSINQLQSCNDKMPESSTNEIIRDYVQPDDQNKDKMQPKFRQNSSKNVANSATRTHNYDSCMLSLYPKLIAMDDAMLIPPISFNQLVLEIREMILCLQNQRPGSKCPEVAPTCRRIVKSSSDSGNKVFNDALRAITMMTNSRASSNYDNKSGISVVDQLSRVWRFIQLYEPDAQLIFVEQLGDMMRGSCAQGRSHRLLQFYTPHMSESDPLFNKLRRINPR